MMGKKSVGGTLFFPILLQWEKRVWGTFANFHRTEGEKEWGGTLFFPICKVGKKSVGVHCFSPSVRWGERVGGYTVSKENESIDLFELVSFT